MQDKNTMDIRVKIKSLLPPDGRDKAFVDITLGHCFVIPDVRVRQGSNGLYAKMPSMETNKGYRDVCFPTTPEFRQRLDVEVLAAYQHARATWGRMPGQDEHQDAKS